MAKKATWWRYIGDKMKKKMFACLLALAVPMLTVSAVMAEDSVTTPTESTTTTSATLPSAFGLDISSLTSNVRIGVFIPFKGGTSLKTAYTPLKMLCSSSGVEYLSIDVGAAAYSNDLEHGYVYAGIGMRIDNISSRFDNISDWTKSHIKSVSLPTIEAGVSAILIKSQVIPGASIALKF